MRSILVLILLGVSACTAPLSDAAFCGSDYTTNIAALRAGLEQNPQTPDAVGEPAVNVVLGHEAGCG